MRVLLTQSLLVRVDDLSEAEMLRDMWDLAVWDSVSQMMWLRDTRKKTWAMIAEVSPATSQPQTKMGVRRGKREP